MRRFPLNTKKSVRRIAIAIYTVNRHAKTAPNNKELYLLKKMSLEKLIRSNDAKKIGLHFVENPKFSQQHSTTLVRCADFLFHMIPEKEDFKSLPHLGHQNQTSRNPQERMSLRTAKEVLIQFTEKEVVTNKARQRFKKESQKKKPSIQNTSNFRSSYLDG